jgi:hypothetical protein
MECLLGQNIPFLAAGGLSVTVVHGEAMVSCLPWVRRLERGLILWDLALWAISLGEPLEGVDGALPLVDIFQVNQIMTS